MPIATLIEIETAIRSSWSRETADPAQPGWLPDNPARGQCAVTALVVNDLCGGEVLIAEAWNADGSRQGYHYWNRLAGGLELDLTREQFYEGERVSDATVAPIPQDRTSARLALQYRRLQEKVYSALGMGIPR